MKKNLTGLIVLSAILLTSWGSAGHYRISEMSSFLFTGELFEFNNWLPYIADHASDADTRKQWDDSEGPKHYIDIDNYALFLSEGRIPQALDSCVTLYGSSFVEDNGYLPWATIACYDTLLACFTRRDWDKARTTTADLSHYVADGHMPLHITRNYNGQYTNNYGIHSRYESYMVGRYLDELSYIPDSYSPITDVQAYIFSYLYDNYTRVDSILDADSYAQEEAGDDDSNFYYQLLWGETGDMTRSLFSRSTTALVTLLYQAWNEAGKPEFGSSLPDGTGVEAATSRISCYPNPFTTSVHVQLSHSGGNVASLFVYESTGKLVEELQLQPYACKSEKLIWSPKNLCPGSYYLVYREKGILEVKKLIYLGE